MSPPRSPPDLAGAADARAGMMTDFVAEIAPQTDAISALTERVMAHLADCGVDSRAAHHVALVLDELLTNVAMHDGLSAGPVAIRVGVSAARVSGEVVDGGKPFDPSLERQSIAAEGVERPPGGLGLLLVRRLTEGLVYERVGERNRTTFSICRAAD